MPKVHQQHPDTGTTNLRGTTTYTVQTITDHLKTP